MLKCIGYKRQENICLSALLMFNDIALLNGQDTLRTYKWSELATMTVETEHDLARMAGKVGQEANFVSRIKFILERYVFAYIFARVCVHVVCV